MVKNKFYHSYNVPPHHIEKNDGSSITNPDPGLSIAQMVERYVLGNELPVGKQVYYDESEDTMIETGTDLSDITVAVDDYDRSIEHAKAVKSKSRKIPHDNESGGTDFREAEGKRRAERTTKEESKRDVPKADPPPDSGSGES